MTFSPIEVSNYGGQPIRLYQFKRAGKYWRYAAADSDVVYGGDTYTAAAISDSGVTQNSEGANDELTVTAPPTLDIFGLFRGVPPSDSVWLTVRVMHDGDTEAPVFWSGTVSAVSLGDAATATMTCNTLIATLARNGLRLTWERNCPYSLYDHNCGVDKESHALNVVVTVIDGSLISADAFALVPAQYFTNGLIEWDLGDGAIERRGIQLQNGSQLMILAGTDGLTTGTTIRAYPGCQRTTDYCLGVFNNLDNEGGFPWMPGLSPFDGRTVF